jgi:hypothetical protein
MKHGQCRKAVDSVFSSSVFDPCFIRGSVLVLALVLCGESSAAPPAITYLYPAGGQRGTTVEVTAGGTFERWPVQVWTSDKAVAATASKDKGKLSIVIAADAVPGVYWLRLHDEQGASTLRPFLVGTLPDVAEKEPNDEPAKAQAVKLPAVVNGRIEKAGDVDVFAVMLKKGATLVASVDAYRTLKSPMDGVLQVLSADGFVLEQNNDWHGLDPQVVFNVSKDGTYLVRLFAFPAVADASIRLSGGETFIYRLTLTTGGFADYPVPLAVERKAGAKVEINGWNIPAEARSLPVALEGNVATVFHPQLANPVRVRLENHPCWDLTRPSGPLAVPFSATGRLSRAGDANTFPILGKKGQALAIRVESRALELPVNPVIRVLDGTGKQLARGEPADLNKDTELAFTPPADGQYTIEVRDLHGGGGPRFVYRVRVAPPEPDFDVNIAADRFAVAPGKPLDIPVTIVRRGGLAKDIEVTAEGLPAGVVAAVVPPMGKADPNKITVRLTVDKPGPSGPFQIVGRSKEPALTRVAKAPLAEFETTTSDLWLAVGGEVPAAVPKKKK